MSDMVSYLNQEKKITTRYSKENSPIVFNPARFFQSASRILATRETLRAWTRPNSRTEFRLGPDALDAWRETLARGGGGNGISE